MGRQMKTLAERFWEKVLKREGDDACWVWVGAWNSKGYGHMIVERKTVSAHIISWFLEYGVWPKKCMLHECDLPRCVRPKHLWEGTHVENMKDMFNKGRNFDPGFIHAKLTNEDIEQIRKIGTKMAQSKLGEKFDVSQTAISKILRNWS